MVVSQQSVLIVDRSQENREVLQTVLERRGWRTLSASRVDRGLELAREHQPDLIVLDLEIDGVGSDVVNAAFAGDSRIGGITLVILGSLGKGCPAIPGGEFIAKPYQYGPLIRKIEELLETTSRSHRSALTVRDPRQRSGDPVRID